MRKLIHDRLMTSLLVLATMVTVIMVLIAQRYELILKTSADVGMPEEYAQSFLITGMDEVVAEEEGDAIGIAQYAAPAIPSIAGNIVYQDCTGSTFDDSFDTVIADVYLKYSELPLAELQSGRYPTTEEFQRGDKLIVIGNGLLPFTRQRDDVLYIGIDNEEYQVIGVFADAVGSDDDERLFMFFPSMGEEAQQELLETLHTGVARLVYESSSEVDAAESILDAWLRAEFPETEWEITTVADAEDTVLGDVSKMVYELSRYMVMLVYAFGVISCFSVARIWAKRRAKEMMIRMAFGESKSRIGMGFCFNLLCIQALGTVMAFAVMLAVGSFGSRGVLLTNMKYGNIVVQVLLIFLITAIVPLAGVRRLSPAQGLQKWKVQG